MATYCLTHNVSLPTASIESYQISSSVVVFNSSTSVAGTTKTFTINRDAIAMINFAASYKGGADKAYSTVGLYVDGELRGFELRQYPYATGYETIGSPASNTVIGLTAGQHTIELRANSNVSRFDNGSWYALLVGA